MWEVPLVGTKIVEAVSKLEPVHITSPRAQNMCLLNSINHLFSLVSPYANFLALEMEILNSQPLKEEPHQRTNSFDGLGQQKWIKFIACLPYISKLSSFEPTY
jgi:hypothetical protein